MTILACHRHLEKHKDGDLHLNPEMIFPPVTTTEVCVRFTLCVWVCTTGCVCASRGTTCKGFPWATSRGFVKGGGGGPWTVIAFPALSSQRHTYIQTALPVKTQWWRLTHAHKKRKNNKNKSKRSGSVATILFHRAGMHQTNTKNHFAMDSSRINPHSLLFKICLHSLICHRFYTLLSLFFLSTTYCAAAREYKDFSFQAATKHFQLDFCTK